jgi:hypothetical protein
VGAAVGLSVGAAIGGSSGGSSRTSCWSCGWVTLHDEVLMRQCTCDGAYKSDEVVCCIQCKGLFLTLGEGLGIDDTYYKDIIMQQFTYSRCNAAATALPPSEEVDDNELYQLHDIYMFKVTIII